MLKPDAEKCKAMGLSLFDSKQNAQAQFELLKRRFKQDFRRMGTHISEGTLQKGDGVSDLPNRYGHSTFHPYEDADLKNHFIIIAPL